MFVLFSPSLWLIPIYTLVSHSISFAHTHTQTHAVRTRNVMGAIIISINTNVKLGPTFRRMEGVKDQGNGNIFAWLFHHFFHRTEIKIHFRSNTQEDERHFLSFAIFHLMDWFAIHLNRKVINHFSLLNVYCSISFLFSMPN